jgi:septum formation protein
MPNQPRKLILASQSPRRRQLLAKAGFEFNVIVPGDNAESGKDSHETPNELVARLAYQKAADVARRVDHGVVLGCDTVAECAGRILGKPSDRQQARKMLQLLRGRVHHVYSGVCLWRRPDDKTLTKADVTKLRMEPISDNQLESHLDSGGWEGKAGAFGYQDRLGWIHIVAGSESNVVGLPMDLLVQMMGEFT